MQPLEQLQKLDFPAPLPETVLQVEQRFDAPKIGDPEAATIRALDESGLLSPIQAGESVAIGVGSRGIANQPLIVRTLIRRLQARGAEPFLIPAMGSHAGATAEGQTAMLAELGFSLETMGVDVRATMAVNEIARLPDGPPLYQDAFSAEADHTLLVNRIKPHTAFRSALESGLAKMAVIGLGKQKGAAAMHALGIPAFKKYLAPAARIYEEKTNLRGGLALLENAYDETAAIVGLNATEIGGPKEVELQQQAKDLMASLPFPEIEVLVVRQSGKNISGTGMDPNILGRLLIPREPERFGGPDIAIIAVLNLSEGTHGNAHGIGLANVTTARVAQQVDWVATYTNALTAGILGMQRTSFPLTLPNDRAALQAALRGCARPAKEARLVFIHDTLTLNQLWTSPNMRAEIEAHPRLTVADEVPLTFSATGCMNTPWSLPEILEAIPA